MPAKHRAPDDPSDVTTSKGEKRRAPKPGEKTRRKPSYKRAPVEVHTGPVYVKRSQETTQELPKVKPLRSDVPFLQASNEDRRERRAAAAAGEANEYARRAAIRHTTGKPSVTGRATAGAAAGAASGGAVGGPVGAGLGALVGGVGGGVSGSKAKRDYRKALRRTDTAGPRKLLVAEFLVCAVITAFSPLTAPAGDEKPATTMKRFTAVMGLFFILGLISAAGRSSARLAAGFGGMLTVALLVSQRDLFVQLARIFNASDKPAPTSDVASDMTGRTREEYPAPSATPWRWTARLRSGGV